MPDSSTVAIFFGAVAAGQLCTWLARAFARRRGIVNHPNPIIPQHKTAVAYLGGVGIFMGIVATLALIWLLERADVATAGEMPEVHWRLALPAGLFVAVGTADDLLTFSPKWKLAAQLAVAGLAVWLGLALDLTHNATIDAALSVFWLVALVNAFNLTDVCDGLLAGIACISLLAVALVSPGGADIALLCCGVTLGFLVFNFPPASIYLGDGGSHLLGFLCAAQLMVAAEGRPAWPFAAGAVLIVAVPLFELVFLCVVRMRKGLPWWRGSPDHFSLRLQQAGLSRPWTDAVSWSMAALLAGFGIAALRGGERLVWLLIAVAVALLAGAWRWLLRHEVQMKR